MCYYASLLAHVWARLDSSLLFSKFNGTRIGPEEITGKRAVIFDVFFLRFFISMAESRLGSISYVSTSGSFYYRLCKDPEDSFKRGVSHQRDGYMFV